MTAPRRARYERPFDLAVLALAFVGLLPLWILLALVVPVAIRLDSPGPVLYRQPRLGRGGKVFGIVKWRTMRHGAEAGTGPVLARPGDRRLTAVGRVLRRWHVDELPQAWNILRGEMSLVGPRPERPELAARFASEAPGFSRRLATRPGVMGLAQWRGGYRLAPRWKLRYDELYLRRMGPWLDLRLAVLCVARAMARSRPSRPYRRRLARERRVDYLLIAGPGRSGSTYLFEGLIGRGDFVAPAIKEGACYRAPGRLRRAVARLPAGAVLLDGANAAWRDAGAVSGFDRLSGPFCRPRPAQPPARRSPRARIRRARAEGCAVAGPNLRSAASISPCARRGKGPLRGFDGAARRVERRPPVPGTVGVRRRDAAGCGHRNRRLQPDLPATGVQPGAPDPEVARPGLDLLDLDAPAPERGAQRPVEGNHGAEVRDDGIQLAVLSAHQAAFHRGELIGRRETLGELAPLDLELLLGKLARPAGKLDAAKADLHVVHRLPDVAPNRAISASDWMISRSAIRPARISARLISSCFLARSSAPRLMAMARCARITRR